MLAAGELKGEESLNVDGIRRGNARGAMLFLFFFYFRHSAELPSAVSLLEPKKRMFICTSRIKTTDPLSGDGRDVRGEQESRRRWEMRDT